jgi:hypothetical protein
MLKIPDQELSPVFPRYWERFEQAVGPAVPDALIIHDSFYTKAVGALRILFPGMRMAHINDPAAVADALAASPRRILANIVERSVVRRLLLGDLSWSSPFGGYLLAANVEAAAGCSFTSLDVASLRMRNLVVSASGSLMAQRDSQIHVPLPEGGPPCIRIAMTVDSSDRSELFLPRSIEGADVLAASFSVQWPDAGRDRDLVLTLPESFAGRTVRFDPIGSAGEIPLLRIEIGTRPECDLEFRCL